MNNKHGFFERKRKPLTAVVAVVGILFAAVTYDGLAQAQVVNAVLSWGGIILVVIGIMGRLWSTLHIGGHKNKDLVTTGPYALCRNPLYFFSFLAGVGVSMEFENFVLIAFFMAAFVAYYPRVIRSEEKRLEEIFGDEFRAYKESTPMFFPRTLRVSLADTPHLTSIHFWKTLRDSSVFVVLVICAVFIEVLQEHGIIHVWRLH